MLLEKYKVVWEAEKMGYEFTSQGPRGRFQKVVQYQHLGGNLYNLAFGDWNEEKCSVDDTVRSNNNDSNKVLATVASTIINFLSKNPDAQIFIQGSTPSRTRLYQMGISKNWSEIRNAVRVIGIADDKAEIFSPQRSYDAFVVQAQIFV